MERIVYSPIRVYVSHIRESGFTVYRKWSREVVREFGG